MRLISRLLLAFVALAPAPAMAQNICSFVGPDGVRVSCSAANPLPTTSAGGGGGGASVAQGSATSGQSGSLVQSATTTAAPTYTTATTNPLSSDTSGNLRVIATGAATAAQLPASLGAKTGVNSLSIVPATDATLPVTNATASNLNAAVVGNVANVTGDSGNPVKVGGVFNTVLPTATTGQRIDAQYTARGEALTTLSQSGLSATIAAATADGQTGTGLTTRSFCYVSNSTNWDRCRGDAVGAYSVLTPTASANNAIAPGSSTVVESSHVAKASAGNVYRVSITTGGTAGYLMGFNATTAPADGAVTPSLCRVIAANSSLSVSYADMPARWGTGITFVFSSTGCFAKTASATAFFEWSVM